MKAKIYFLLILFVTLIVALSCEKETYVEVSDEDTDEILDGLENVENHDDASDYYWDDSELVYITLNGTSISVDGNGATVSGSNITINGAGTYSISGTLTDGQIIVDTEDENIVRLILNGADINCATTAPIYIQNAAKAMIVLADDSENTVTDGTSYATGDDGPNAAIYSEDDLTLYGNGSLIVYGNYNDGITGKDGLIITSGSITVNSADDGIRGKDYLVIKDGNITIDVGGDGLKSDNDEDASKGYIEIETGEINIISGGDAITAETDVLVSYGKINIISASGAGSYINSGLSAKGIKAGIFINIEDGTFNIDAADDAIHSNTGLAINGGTFTIASGDDAIHADYDVLIDGCYIDITGCEEGVESAEADITINSGEIYIKSDDDPINAAGSNSFLSINGGYIVIDAGGDGLDTNGDASITGGNILISCGQSPLDYEQGTFDIDGGFLMAVGGDEKRAESASTSSSQYSVFLNFSSNLSAGTLVHIENSNGEEIITFAPERSYQPVVFSSPGLEPGETYNVYYGGSSTGTEADGLYNGGTYTPGTKYGSFTISSMVTTIN